MIHRWQSKGNQQKMANGTLTGRDIAKYDNLTNSLNEANLILEEGKLQLLFAVFEWNIQISSASQCFTPDFS